MKNPVSEQNFMSKDNEEPLCFEDVLCGDGALSAVSFADSVSYPVILCDSQLYAADISSPPSLPSLCHLTGRSMREHLSKRDTVSLLSCIEYLQTHSDEAKETNLIVELQGISGYSCAFVSFSELFSCIFAELHLFFDRIALLKKFKVPKLMAAAFSDCNRYARQLDGENTDKKLNMSKTLILQSRLHSMYHAAQAPFEKPLAFNAFELTKRIVNDLPHSLDTDVSFLFSGEGRESFRHAVIDATNYVNIVSALMMLCARISMSKTVEAALHHSADRISLIFSTDVDDCDISFVGGFAFSFLAKMYPSAAAYVHAAEYISRLFGLRCYGELSGRNTLSVELLVTPCPPETEIGCMHLESKEFKMLFSKALSLTAQLEQ